MTNTTLPPCLTATPGEGYRLLQPGETIHTGDQWQNVVGGWVTVHDGYVGTVVSESNTPTRRKVNDGGYSDLIKDVISSLYARDPDTRIDMLAELRAWLDQQKITSDNIGAIRCQCFMPWCSSWNAVVRDETAARENLLPMPPPVALHML